MGANDEARQHIVALAQRLHQFGHRTEERELELWHWLSNAADWSGAQCRLARSQEMWESEYNKFIAELPIFVNKEISEFRHSVLSVREYATQLQGTAQATSQRMDRIQNEVTSIRRDLKEQIDRAVQEAKTELRTELAAMIN